MITTPDTWTRAWRPDVDGVEEVFHARFTTHSYPSHVHSNWTVMLLDTGAVAYQVDRRRRIAFGTSITVLPPHVAHDGRSTDPGHPFEKRVLYISEARLPAALIGKAVDTSSIQSPTLHRNISLLHHLLADARDDTDDLVADETLLAIVEGIRGSLTPGDDRAPSGNEAAEALRSHLDDHLYERQRLTAIAQQLGWDARHLVRSFSATFGLPPHRYLIGRRVEAARRELLDGRPAATVATNVGFHDQAHLTRHFRAFTGTTPARFAKSGRATTTRTT